MRLIFKSSLDVGGYWGIEETDWADAPALANPSYTRRLAGRDVRLLPDGLAHPHGRGARARERALLGR